MAILKQSLKQNAAYMGWYGKCGEPKCAEFDLKKHRDVISKVFQFTEDGHGTRSFISDAPDQLSAFSNLMCGNVYWIVLKKGNGYIDIPEFTNGYVKEDKVPLGFISDCATTHIVNPPEDDKPITEKPCTKDVRICPDGSYVGRDGTMDCNFTPCYFNKTDHTKMISLWKEKEINHYQFDFNWVCYCTEETTQEVTIYVKYQKIYKIVVKNTSEEISKEQNEGTDPNKPRMAMKYLSLSELYGWMKLELSKFPFSVKVEYENSLGYMSSVTIDRNKDIADDEIGFNVSNFKILPIEKKCPPDYKKCSDGTILKRDPNNDCRFPDCPKVSEPTPTPKPQSDNKLEFRWMKSGNYEFLQVKNILNPWLDKSSDKFLGWRTVYGAKESDPNKIKTNHWKHAKVESDHKQDLYDLEIGAVGIDDENENQLILYIEKDARFLPNHSDVGKASHLYVFINDTETTTYKAWSYMRIIKVSEKMNELGMCPPDIKTCKDGTLLYRDPDLNCEFDNCPDEEDDATPFSIMFGEGDLLETPESDFVNDDEDNTIEDEISDELEGWDELDNIKYEEESEEDYTQENEQSDDLLEDGIDNTEEESSEFEDFENFDEVEESTEFEEEYSESGEFNEESSEIEGFDEVEESTEFEEEYSDSDENVEDNSSEMNEFEQIDESTESIDIVVGEEYQQTDTVWTEINNDINFSDDTNNTEDVFDGGTDGMVDIEVGSDEQWNEMTEDSEEYDYTTNDDNLTSDEDDLSGWSEVESDA